MAEVMTTDQSSVADDAALFQEMTAPGAATSEAPAEQPAPPAPQTSPAPSATPPPSEPEAMIPSARLREEADRSRAAERRADQLQAQVEALMQRFQPVQQTPPRQRTDVFENPSQFVQEEVQPLLTPLEQRLMQRIEFSSKRDAMKEFGPQLVDEAYRSIEQGLRARDPEVAAVYNRAMGGVDPWGDIVQWHRQKQTYAQIGGDLNAYNQRILQQALQNPEFQAQVIAAARNGAPAIAAPVRGGEQPRAANGQFTSPASLPSIARVGSTGLTPEDQGQDNESDADLFAKVTSRGAKAPR